MGNERITLPDEAPLRMILSSCLEHGKPMTAVRVLNVGKKSLRLSINAATYSLYNQVLLKVQAVALNEIKMTGNQDSNLITSVRESNRIIAKMCNRILPTLHFPRNFIKMIF